MKRLDRKFFDRLTIKVAQELLGKFLVCKIDNKIIKARIIETEAYCGTRDLACHASKGLKTVKKYRRVGLKNPKESE